MWTFVVVLYHIKPFTMFHDTIKALRIEKRLTLREFCLRVGLDPSNWSKVERGINPPPGDIELLEKLADFFALEHSEKLSLIDAAALERREIPPDLADNEILMRALPAFFRAARGHELSEHQLEEFLQDVKKLHSPDRA